MTWSKISNFEGVPYPGIGVTFSMISSRAKIQDFVRRFRRDKHKWLWDLAHLAPFGGMVISTDSKNPYLLRVYLTPSREDLEVLGVPKKWLDRLGVHDPLRVYLHFFFRGDSDRELHNHPKRWALSLILTDGYLEERWDPLRKRVLSRLVRRFDFNVIRKTDFHRVLLTNPADGCWTLFFSHGREQKSNGYDWGFLDAETEKYTPWGEWVDARKAAA